jgi:hypothetical protein
MGPNGQGQELATRLSEQSAGPLSVQFFRQPPAYTASCQHPARSLLILALIPGFCQCWIGFLIKFDQWICSRLIV